MNEIPYLHPHQVRSAGKIAELIAGNYEAVLAPPPVGIGRSVTLLIGILRGFDGPFTALIACPENMVAQWVLHVNRYAPGAGVIVSGRSTRSIFIGRSTKTIFTHVEGQFTEVADLEDIARVGSEEWKRDHPQPSFFIMPFRHLKNIPPSMEKWFDIALEDENFPSVNMDAIRLALSTFGRKTVRIDTIPPHVDVWSTV